MHILKTGERPSLEHLSVVVDVCLKNRYTGPSRVSKIHHHQCSEICEHNKIVGWYTVHSCTSTRLSELSICVGSHGLESRREALQCPKCTRRQDHSYPTDKPRYPIESDDHSMLAPQRERWPAKPPCIPLGAERSLLRVLAHQQASGSV